MTNLEKKLEQPLITQDGPPRASVCISLCGDIVEVGVDIEPGSEAALVSLITGIKQGHASQLILEEIDMMHDSGEIDEDYYKNLVQLLTLFNPPEDDWVIRPSKVLKREK